MARKSVCHSEFTGRDDTLSPSGRVKVSVGATTPVYVLKPSLSRLYDDARTLLYRIRDTQPDTQCEPIEDGRRWLDSWVVGSRGQGRGEGERGERVMAIWADHRPALIVSGARSFGPAWFLFAGGTVPTFYSVTKGQRPFYPLTAKEGKG